MSYNKEEVQGIRMWEWLVDAYQLRLVVFTSGISVKPGFHQFLYVKPKAFRPSHVCLRKTGLTI